MTDSVVPGGGRRSGRYAALARALAPLALAILAFVLGRERLLSLSVDVAHHLQLALALRDHLVLPEQAAGFMGEMYVYPNLAHRAAAVLMRLGLDPVSAMSVLAAGASLAAWSTLLDLARRTAGWGMLSGAFGIAILTVLGVGVIGHEVVGNFFFAQLVGEAAVLLLAAALTRLPRGLPFVLAGAAAVLLATCIHLLPAMKLAGCLMLLLLVQAGEDLRHSGPSPAALLGLLLLPTVLVASPAFRAMLTISENDGAIDLGAPVGPTSLAALAVLLAFVCLAGVAALRRRAGPTENPPRRETAARLLFAYGLATAGALIAQLLAWGLLGLSSPYAVLKHGFGVFSLLAVCAPVAVALWRAPEGEDPADHDPFAFPLACGLAALIAAATLLRPSLMPVREVAALVAEARTLKAANGLADAEPVYFAASDRPPLIDYLVSVAALHSPRDANALAILSSDAPVDLRQVRYMATHRGDRTFSAPSCARGRPTSRLALYDGPCLTGEWGPPPILFRAGDQGAAYLTSGWSTPEAGGAWSVARVMSLTLPTPPDIATAEADLRLEIVLFAFLHERSPRRTARVRLVSGSAAAAHTFKVTEPNEHVFALPVAPAVRRSGAATVEVEVEVLDPVTPRSLKLGPDDRALGVGVKAARWVYAPRPGSARPRSAATRPATASP